MDTIREIFTSSDRDSLSTKSKLYKDKSCRISERRLETGVEAEDPAPGVND